MDRYLLKNSIKYFIFLLLTVYLAIDFNYSLLAIQPQWQLLSALCFALIITGQSFYERIAVIIICGMMAAMLVFLSAFMSFSIYLQAFFLAVVTFVAAYLGQCHINFFLPAFIVNVFVILVSVSPTNIIENSHRSLAILVGCMIVSILQVIFLLQYKYNLLQRNLHFCLQRLQTLNHEIFNCFLQEDYADNLYLYERRIHVAKVNYLHMIKNLQNTNKLSKNNELMIDNYNELYLNLMDCAQLRLRVSDPATFSLCRKELQNIFEVINKKFSALEKQIAGKSGVIETDDLSFSIDRLEEVITSVLQIAAREPLVFYLFVASLKKYSQTLESLSLISATK